MQTAGNKSGGFLWQNSVRRLIYIHICGTIDEILCRFITFRKIWIVIVLGLVKSG